MPADRGGNMSAELEVVPSDSASLTENLGVKKDKPVPDLFITQAITPTLTTQVTPTIQQFRTEAIIPTFTTKRT